METVFFNTLFDKQEETVQVRPKVSVVIRLYGIQTFYEKMMA